MPKLPFIGLLVLLLTAAGCSSAPPPEPATDWLAPAGAEDVVLLVAGEPVELPASPSELSEPLVVTLALRHSALLQVELAHLRAAAAEAAQTRQWPNPLLTVAVRFQESGGLEMDLGLGLALGQLLNREGRQRAADARLQAAAASALAVALEESAGASLAYAAHIQQDESLLRILRQENIATELLALAQRGRDAGELGASELAAAQERSARRAADTAALWRDMAAAERDLAARIGEPGTYPMWFRTPGGLPESGELEHWLAAADERSPAVMRARWLAEAATAEAELAGAPVRDGLEAGVSAELDGDWSAGPALTVPLPFFDNGSLRRNRAEAEAIAAAHLLVAERRAARKSVTAAWANLRGATERRAALQARAMPPAAARWKLAQSSASAGEATLAQVLLAEEALLEIEADVTRAEFEIRAYHAQLLAAAGGGLPAPAPARP